nr:immunoglobulin light chain junction region [Macaca mulatta]MOX79149.1 immunoglobulin light chain junction region [Macaca mulatta]MOX79398.1 immunoglobulin light chain junction region [Macaca mulatta]MOX79898.1 immunoglobulin light chain junction region [Macaca mulatta]MOX81012.1 immunoglobulin light chain junction region [Macaca mulatta]
DYHCGSYTGSKTYIF